MRALVGHQSAANFRMDLHEAATATRAAVVALFRRAAVLSTAEGVSVPGPPLTMERRSRWDSSVRCTAGHLMADRMITSVNTATVWRSGVLAKIVNNNQSKRCLCLSSQSVERSSLVVLLLLLVLMSAVVAPGVDAARRQQRGRKDDDDTVRTTVSSVNCQPVPYDSLWQRLDLYHHPHQHRNHDRRQPSHRGTRSGESPEAQSMAGHGDTLRWKRSVAGLAEQPPPPPTTEKQPSPRNATENGGARSKPVHRTRPHRRKRKRLPGGDRPSRKGGDQEEAVEGETSEQMELWQCDMKMKWKKMAKGTFPPYVQTGKCRQTKCMLGVYECKARKYLVKVMKRIDAACLPVPSIAVNSTYEEAWIFDDVKVTVGCDCVRRKSGHYVLTETGS